MELRHLYGPTPASTQAVVLFCFVWPFVALIFMRSRGRSPAPLAAMLIPVAVGAAGMWISITDVLESLFVLAMGVFSALGVAFFSLFKRHRADGDLVTLLLVLLLGANIAIAVLLAPAAWVPFGAGIAAAIAIGAFFWLIRVWRGRVTPRPIPFVAMTVVIALIALLLMLRQRVMHLILAAG